MESSFIGTSSYMPPFLLGSTDSKISHAPSTKQVISPHGSSGLRLNLTDRDSEQKYVKTSSLKGPPVQRLHENAMNFSMKNNKEYAVSAERRQLNFSALNETSKMDSLDRTDLSKITCEVRSSPAQIDPFFTRGNEVKCDEEYDQCWITVFGFPPSATSYILDQFSQYGSILKHQIFPNCNWIHILYHSRLDAKKALSKNGKVFGKGIMVGVQPCIDKNLMNTSTKEDTQFKDDAKISVSSGMRPLTAAYQASVSSNQVITRNHTVPHKSTGLFSKAIEYMFGW